MKLGSKERNLLKKVFSEARATLEDRLKGTSKTSNFSVYFLKKSGNSGYRVCVEQNFHKVYLSKELKSNLAERLANKIYEYLSYYYECYVDFRVYEVGDEEKIKSFDLESKLGED